MSGRNPGPDWGVGLKLSRRTLQDVESSDREQEGRGHGSVVLWVPCVCVCGDWKPGKSKNTPAHGDSHA